MLQGINKQMFEKNKTKQQQQSIHIRSWVVQRVQDNLIE
jgi:hypothetical protein